MGAWRTVVVGVEAGTTAAGSAAAVVEAPRFVGAAGSGLRAMAEEAQGVGNQAEFVGVGWREAG